MRPVNHLLRAFALMVALLSNAPAHALTNPNFEGAYTPVQSTRATITGNVARGWYDNSSWANVTLRYSKQTKGTRSTGSACQQVEITSVKKGEWQFVQEFNASAGFVYRPGVWLKGTKGARIWLSLRQTVAPFKTYQDVPADLNGAWQFISIPAHLTQSETLAFMLHADRPATFCIDDAVLSAKAEPVTPDILQRPVAATFGMHIENYLDSKGPSNLDLEGTFSPVNSSRATITGKIANHWFDNSDWADVTVTYAANLVKPHAGKKAQQLIVSRVKKGYVQAAQLLYLRFGQTYKAGVWLRGTRGMKLGLALRKWTEPYTDYAARDVTATGGWQYVIVSGKVTDAAVSTIMVRAYSTGTLDFDDATLQDTSGAVPKLALPWPSVPIGSWRLWDQSGTTWARLEPEKGKWNFADLDRAVKQAEARGAQIVLTLGQSPAWASARIGDTSYNGAGAPAEPRNMADWTNYVRKVASRYRGRIFYYEIWNEPNDPTFYTGSVAKLVEMTKLARTVLKKIDSRNKIIGASPYVVGYLQQYLAGVRGDIDIVGYHIYNDPPEDDARILADLRSVMKLRGVSAKPLWITEGAIGSAETPAAIAAGLAARKYLVQLTYGARRFFWYNWGPGHDIGLPMTESNGVTPSAAGKAVAVLQTWLIGSTIQDAFVSGNIWVIKLQTSALKPAYIIWTPSGSSTWTVPPGFSVSAVQDLSEQTNLPPALIEATPEPVLIVGQ